MPGKYQALSYKSFQDKEQNEKQVPVKGMKLCNYAITFTPKMPDSLQQLKDGYEALEGMHPKHMKRNPEPVKKLTEGYKSLVGVYAAMKEIPPFIDGDEDIIKSINEGLVNADTDKDSE